MKTASLAIAMLALVLLTASGGTSAASTPVDCFRLPGWEEIECYIEPNHCLWFTAPVDWVGCAHW